MRGDEIGAMAREIMQDVPVSLSHEVLPEMQEYERGLTTVANSAALRTEPNGPRLWAVGPCLGVGGTGYYLHAAVDARGTTLSFTLRRAGAHGGTG